MNEYHHRETIDLGTICKDTIRARIQQPYLIYLYDGSGRIGYLATTAGLYAGARRRPDDSHGNQEYRHVEACKRTTQLRLDDYVA
jgi:hypothetical protein